MRYSNTAIFATCFIYLMLAVATQTVTAQQPDNWDRLLAQAGLTKQTTHFDFLDMASYGGQEYLLPFFDAMHHEPLRIPFYSRVIKSDFTRAAPSVAELAMAASWRMNEGTRRTLIGNPIENLEKESVKTNALQTVIEAIHADAGKPLSKNKKAELANAIKAVPADIASNAALVVLAEVEAAKARRRALRKLSEAEVSKAFDLLAGVQGEEDDDNSGGRRAEMETRRDAMDDLRKAIDLKYLMAGGIDLSLACDKAIAALSKRSGSEKFAFTWETPLGLICLHGADADTYNADKPSLLIIDSGGNDTYYGGGGTTSAANCASVTLDLSGNDKYLQTPELATKVVAAFEKRKTTKTLPAFGAGILGFGIQVDVAGDDVYRGLSHTQGSGLFGLGILQDMAGSDQYDCYTDGQGAAEFGVGVLADLGGADEYRCFCTSQGYGYTKGCGALVDMGEDKDVYEANDTVIDFPSPQDPKHNGSLAQGAGFGRRADYSDGHSLAGGIGVLVDGGGDNKFTCGVYGQGTGYWYGAGILCSGTGNDTYNGVWYVQGAVAHFAVAMLWDAGGNDVYNATHNMAQGAGHDFGVGFLMDDAGDDVHEAPNLSLGGGNANGFGIFWDKAGNDTYHVGGGTSLGRASIEMSRPLSLRDRNITLGLFLDEGGTDSYPAAQPQTKNDALWSAPALNHSLKDLVRGAGLDAANGTGELS